MSSFKTVILAAGLGTRMKSDIPKCLHELFGIPMLGYVINAARDAGCDDICVVIGHKGEMVRASFENEGLSFAVQSEQKGTAHAVMMAKDFIGEERSDVMILFGDTPLIEGQVLKGLYERHCAEGNAATVLSTVIVNPFGYGRILRDADGRLIGSVEQKDATEEQQKIREVNSGMYCFDSAALMEALEKVDNNNAQGEYLLPDVLNILLAEGRKAEAFITDDASVLVGVNDKEQLRDAEETLRIRVMA